MSTTTLKMGPDGRPPSEADVATDLKKRESARERLRRMLHSQTFHIGICVLIIIDVFLIIIELLVEMNLLETNISHKTTEVMVESPWVHWAHMASVVVLSIFLLEIFVKIYAFGCQGFLKHKLEVFDAFIVVTSLAFDLLFYRTDSAAAIGSGLIITLRLWRVGRLLNGIVLTVKLQAERQLEKEMQLRENLKQQMMTQRDYCNALEQDNKFLRQLLAEKGIKTPPPVEEPAVELTTTTTTSTAE